MTTAMRRALELHGNDATLNRFSSDEEKAAFTEANRLRISITDDDWAKKVLAFHVLTGVPVREAPVMLPAIERQLRVGLLHEEVSELMEAETPIDVLDACLDIIYVAIGTALQSGFTPQQLLLGMEEVHASNMTKVTDTGKALINDGVIEPTLPIGKVLKTSNYVRPDLAEAIGAENTNANESSPHA